MTASFDLVLFDLGGVIHEFDTQAMTRVWVDAGLDPGPGADFFRSAFEREDSDVHPIHRAERGELSLAELLPLAEPSAPGISHLLDASRPTALQRFIRPSTSWATLVRELGQHGVMKGALSNTFDGFDMKMLEVHNPGVHAHIVGLFGDDILESHVLGVRKPTRAAFVAAADYFGVRLERILFIDDYASNCAGATAAGLASIHSGPGQEEAAQERVRELLDLV